MTAEVPKIWRGRFAHLLDHHHMTTDEKLAAILAAVQTDPGNRGLARDPHDNLFTACPGDFAAACRSIAEHRDAVTRRRHRLLHPVCRPAGVRDGRPARSCLPRRALHFGIAVSASRRGTVGKCRSASIASALASAGMSTRRVPARSMRRSAQYASRLQAGSARSRTLSHSNGSGPAARRPLLHDARPRHHRRTRYRHRSTCSTDARREHVERIDHRHRRRRQRDRHGEDSARDDRRRTSPTATSSTAACRPITSSSRASATGARTPSRPGCTCFAG